MEPTKIYQFTKADSIEIIGTNNNNIGPLVNMVQHMGCMRFQFSMTPAQAREMAVALERHAEALEQAK